MLYRALVKLALLAAASASIIDEHFCYVCSGHRCLQNPMDPNLFPGRTKCHEVERYCVTHVRYMATNQSVDDYKDGKPMAPHFYNPHSVTRNCAKTYLGNLCRRDFLGDPHITCISTCNNNFCNCDSRSPPPEMFRGGKVAYESPKKSTYSANDLLSCQAMAGVPGYEHESEQAVRRGRPTPRRRHFRRNNAAAVPSAGAPLLLLLGVSCAAFSGWRRVG